MAPFAKAGPSRLPGTDTPGRPYATYADELNRPYIAGESAAAQRDSAETWRWAVLLILAAAATMGYVYLWPALRAAIYAPTPLRAALLPRSASPLYVVAGVGVGWVWVLFVAAPAAAAALAALWWAALSWSNRQVRAGHHGHVRPGQTWLGERYPAGPLTLLAAAAVLIAAGAALRWAGPAAATWPGQLLMVALLGVLCWGLIQFGRWAYARAGITRQLNTVTYLLSPILGWTDFRGGRVRAGRCRYPRGQRAYPATVTLFYAQSERGIDQEYLDEVAATLGDVTGRVYALSHDRMRCTLIATETEAPAEADPRSEAEELLEPLVASWFDAAASIVSITPMPEPVTADPDTDVGTRKPLDSEDGAAVGDDERSAFTAHDRLAARISEFTIQFAYGLKVSSAYRRGMIEGAVTDALGGSWEADWSMPSRRVRFVRCPGLPTLVDPPLEFPTVTRGAIRKIYARTEIPFAVDAYGNTIGWDFKASPHMLVAGATSTGKTSLLMTIATQCARRGFNVVWVDPKGFDSPGMRDWPNVSLVTAGTDEDGLVGHTAVLRFLADTMRERLSQVKVNPNRADDFDPIVLITDEFSNLVVALAEFYGTYRTTKEKGTPPTTVDVGILLRTARAVGIHMALGIQRPDTMFIAGEARDNTALRVAMGRLRSKDAAIMMFNDAVAGTRLQPGIKGRGTVQLPDGTFREIQAFYTPKVPATAEQRAQLSDHERDILRRLGAVDSFWPRRVVDSALRGYDPTDDEQKADMSFAKIRDSAIVLAADRPDLDPLSDRYVPPAGGGARRPTMDDDHRGVEADTPAVEEADHHDTGARFTGRSDYDDDYLPGVEDEYGPALTVTADEVRHGDLLDICVDGVSDWRYVHADPYPSEGDDGTDRLIIPYRNVDDGLNSGDLDVDPYEVFQARRLTMD